MDVLIRPVTEEQYEEWRILHEATFGEEIRLEDVRAERPLIELDRTWVVTDDDRMVATAAIFSYALTVPGSRAVPAAGVTLVGVLPTHRRRGLLRTLVRQMLDQAREREEPVAALYASEAPIYGRFGFGVATFDAEFEIERAHATLRRQPSSTGRTRLVKGDEVLTVVADTYERARLAVPGTLTRSPAWWEHHVRDPEHGRDGAGPRFYAVYESGDGVDGYVSYRVTSDWSTGLATNTLSVKDLVALTDDAYLALWQYCFDVDLVETVAAHLRVVDEPLRHLLVDPRRLRISTLNDGLWVRLVDLPAALAGRGYAIADRLVLDVRDQFEPANEGRWVLDAAPEGASCTRTDAEPDLVCDVADLGSAYLGGVRLTALARAGRVAERSAGAVARADALFGHDPAPVCTTSF